jgi:hypothetical protein
MGLNRRLEKKQKRGRYSVTRSCGKQSWISASQQHHPEILPQEHSCTTGTDSLEAHTPPAPERHRSPHPQTKSLQKRPQNSPGGTALQPREASERGGEPAAGGNRTDGTLAPHASSAALGVGGSRRIRGFSWGAASARDRSERAEGIIPNVEVVTEKAVEFSAKNPRREKTVCDRCSANKALMAASARPICVWVWKNLSILDVFGLNTKHVCLLFVAKLPGQPDSDFMVLLPPMKSVILRFKINLKKNTILAITICLILLNISFTN